MFQIIGVKLTFHHLFFTSGPDPRGKFYRLPRKTFDGLFQSIFRSHRHFLHAQGSLDLSVRHHVVLGQLLHAEAIQWEVFTKFEPTNPWTPVINISILTNSQLHPLYSRKIRWQRACCVWRIPNHSATRSIPLHQCQDQPQQPHHTSDDDY